MERNTARDCDIWKLIKDISSFPDEDEYLFFGGRDPIRIAAVVCVKTTKNYVRLYSALLGFDCLTDGWRPHGNMTERLKSWFAEYLGNLINNQISGDSISEEASNSMDEYTMDTFTAYCAFRETATVNMWCLDKFIPLSLRQLILSEIQENASVSDLSENASLNMPNLKVFQIFENLKTLYIHSTSRRGTVFYPLNIENLILELRTQAAVLSADFSAVIVKARVWTESGGDQQSDDDDDDDEEPDNSTKHKPSPMNAKQSRFGGTGFRSWIDELWQKSGDSLREMVNQRLSGWSISYEIGGRVQKDTNLGNEDHLVIRRVTEERKDDDEVITSMGSPKSYPGDYWKDQYPNQIDPRGEPTVIRFQWNKEMKEMTDCDTQHMLYLLQMACELYRRRVIERNKYFQWISRSDRYIDHLDTPQIIADFVQWHDDDKEHNVFTGQMLKTRDAPSMIDLIRTIGGIKRGPSTLLYHQLMNEVMIEYDEWTETGSNRLELKTWGFHKMYSDEKLLEECTVEDMVTLFSFVNEEVIFDGDVVPEDTVNGVFAYIEATAPGMTAKYLLPIDGWKETVIESIREQQLDGNKLASAVLSRSLKALVAPIRAKLEPNDPKKAKRLTGSIGKMLHSASRLPVHRVLKAAKAQTESNSAE